MFDLTITTDRLSLRPFTLDDAPRVRELAGDWEVARMMVHIPHPYPEGAAEKWIASQAAEMTAGTAYNFAIEMDGELTGAIGLHVEDGIFVLGYWLGVQYWGRGIMSEAAKAVVDHFFDGLSVPQLIASHIVGNIRSARILEKVGFERVGTAIRHSHARNADIEHVLLALTRDAWMKKQV